MAIISKEGSTKPFEDESYYTFGERVPALRSFYLAFDVGDPTPGDRELRSIGVMTGGQSQDLSPNVNFQPARIADGRLQLEFQDATPSSGEEFYYRISHSTLEIPGIRRYQIRQVGNVGEVIRKLPSEIFPDALHPSPFGRPILALVGFRMFFGVSGEHELERVGIWFEDDDLHIVLADQGVTPRDDYSFLVDFVVIPPAGMSRSQGVERGVATGGRRIYVPTHSHAHLFLTGWEFRFTNGDHEIREIGIDRQGSNYIVFYSDKNADDPFDWRIEWAQIAPQVVISG